jgi:UTP--hexose-1-phosphate uridylyltransferase
MQTVINNFVEQVIQSGLYKPMDYSYVKNRVLALVGEEGANTPTSETDIKKLKDMLVELAEMNGKVGSLSEEKDCLGAELMNFITPIPSAVNEKFWSTYQESPEKAVNDFYQLSKDNDYIKLSAIAKNIAFRAETKYGSLEITINLSKPEKDPKAIAAEKLMKASNYPKCLLCMENEGYQGRVNYPARANHRVIRMKLGDEEWGLQYSPYSYFNEHAIFLNTKHIPMAITPKTFEQLLEIVDIIPGYFAGSNADLPIAGGSILSHNHYQGGKYVFPMEVAECETNFLFSGFEDIQAGIVKWPMSVLRLRGTNKQRIVELASKILKSWQGYTDLEADIIAATGEVPHHTITPIARVVDGQFEMDLVLRDNHTSEFHPDGVYHPHKDVQHIKKENIGLIEVMGLAILPPRLKTELEEVEKYLLGKENAIADYHLEWADQLKEKYPNVKEEEVNSVVQHEVGQVFARVLEDAGVYKNTPFGHEAFMRFVKSVGIN